MKLEVTALFASDGTQLGKEFRIEDGELKTQSYPHVLKFHSVKQPVRTIDELGAWTEAVAAKGGCLLKGTCHKDLDGQSRAGSTQAQDETSWLCLDIDGLKGIETVDEFLKVLPAPFQNTSYVVQYSSSMGVKAGALSAHIFMLIKSTKAANLKRWLQQANYQIPELAQEISLARSGVALKYTLDISTCQNDKLIYVAPAKLGRGVKNNFKEPLIQVIKKRYATLNYDFATEIDVRSIQRTHLKTLNALRKEEGLPARRSDATTLVHDIEVLSNVKDNIEITGERVARDFAYLNLNGGDSWGYYHPVSNPEVLLNFKGEPCLLIEEVFPSYYAAAKDRARTVRERPASDGDSTDGDTTGDTGALAEPGSESGARPPDVGEDGCYTIVGIVDNTSAYFGLRYEPKTQSFRFTDIGPLAQVKHFCKSYAVPVPDILHRWTIGYDFADTSYRLDFDELRINLYNPPPYMHARKYKSVPKIISKVIKHVTGDDDEAYERFLNWNACILQHRRLIGTAWLLSGTQGTGKGIYFNHIMSKVLGMDYVARTTLPAFEKEFNAFMERALMVFVDEIRIAELAKASTALSNLKQLITDEHVALRKMRTDTYMVPNHANFIFASNHYDSMEVDPSDRRFLIAPRQESPLLEVVTPEDIETKLPAELERFAGYLRGRSADLTLAREMYQSAERKRLQELTRDSADAIIDALRTGDIRFFLDNAPSKELHGQVALDTGLDNPPTYEEFLRLITEELGASINITRDMIEVVFYHINRNTFKTPHKFTKFLGRRGLEIKNIRIGDEVTRGAAGLLFQADSKTMRECKQWLSKRKAHLKAVPNTGKGSKSTA